MIRHLVPNTALYLNSIIITVIAVVAFVVHLAAEVINRITDPKIMRERVNGGSDLYFADRGSAFESAQDAMYLDPDPALEEEFVKAVPRRPRDPRRRLR